MVGPFDAIRHQAERLFQQERYGEAEVLFLDLLSGHPLGYPDVYNRLGLIHHHRHQLERAAEFFERAVGLNSRYTEAAVNLALTYIDLGRYEDAHVAMEQAARVAGEGPTGDPYILGKLANEHAMLGDRYFELGKLDEALDEYRRALTLRPHFADIMTKIGVTMREKGQLDEAIRVLLRAKEVAPRYNVAKIQLGVTYYMKGFMNLAQREWESVEDSDPGNRSVKVYLSLARGKQTVEDPDASPA